ncbi:MAG: IS66 family transposase, partial [Aquincola sp.]|nr:IS66 family transposase [Aquincola sp.]
ADVAVDTRAAPEAGALHRADPAGAGGGLEHLVGVVDEELGLVSPQKDRPWIGLHIPPLGGLVITSPKPQAEVPLDRPTSDGDDPEFFEPTGDVEADMAAIKALGRSANPISRAVPSAPRTDRLWRCFAVSPQCDADQLPRGVHRGADVSEPLVHVVLVAVRRRVEAAHVEEVLVGERRLAPAAQLVAAVQEQIGCAERVGDGEGDGRALRQAESVPLWRELERVILDIKPKVDKKSPLGKALTYWTRQQPTLRAFLDDGRFPISNAHVERLLRVVSTFRKNSLFVGSLEAGERYANLLTLLLNCELAGVNPSVYLVDVIDKISADWPADRVAELLPRAWLAARQPEQQAPSQAAVVAVM